MSDNHKEQKHQADIIRRNCQLLLDRINAPLSHTKRFTQPIAEILQVADMLDSPQAAEKVVEKVTKPDDQ